MDIRRYNVSSARRARIGTSTRHGDDVEDEFDGIEMECCQSGSSPINSPSYRPEGKRLSGRNASRYFASLSAHREQEKERLRQEQNTPKAVERMLKEMRSRPRRRIPLSRLPNPIIAAQSFLADPVTRFWLGCNICVTMFIFGGFVMFMLLLYPVSLRPVLKY